MKKFFMAALAIITLSSFTIAPAGAYDIKGGILDPCDAGYVIDGCPEGENTSINALETRVSEIIRYAMWAVGILAVVFLIYGSIVLASSAGTPEKVKKAKTIILFSLIGLVLAISANIIISLVFKATNEFST
jgi:hypothetical protein